MNFFNVGSIFYLVDLPGYGYVQGLGSQRGTRHFVKVGESYLKERAGKEYVELLILVFFALAVRPSVQLGTQSPQALCWLVARRDLENSKNFITAGLLR